MVRGVNQLHVDIRESDDVMSLQKVGNEQDACTLELNQCDLPSCT